MILGVPERATLTVVLFQRRLGWRRVSGLLTRGWGGGGRFYSAVLHSRGSASSFWGNSDRPFVDRWRRAGPGGVWGRRGGCGAPFDGEPGALLRDCAEGCSRRPLGNFSSPRRCESASRSLAFPFFLPPAPLTEPWCPSPPAAGLWASVLASLPPSPSPGPQIPLTSRMDPRVILR